MPINTKTKQNTFQRNTPDAHNEWKDSSSQPRNINYRKEPKGNSKPEKDNILNKNVMDGISRRIEMIGEKVSEYKYTDQYKLSN